MSWGLCWVLRVKVAKTVLGLLPQVTCHLLPQVTYHLLPQVTCHELCRWLRCILQGALSLDEALRWPPDLCPICLRNLQHVLGFKLVDRCKVSCALGPEPPPGGELGVSPG